MVCRGSRARVSAQVSRKFDGDAAVAGVTAAADWKRHGGGGGGDGGGQATKIKPQIETGLKDNEGKPMNKKVLTWLSDTRVSLMKVGDGSPVFRLLPPPKVGGCPSVHTARRQR